MKAEAEKLMNELSQLHEKTKRDPFTYTVKKCTELEIEIIIRVFNKVSQERDIEWMRHLLKWGNKPAKLCPVLPLKERKE